MVMRAGGLRSLFVVIGVRKSALGVGHNIQEG